MKVEYPHEVMKAYTEETYGVVVYQEQVMRTMREVGKMSWKDTAEIRKLISRSQGVEKFDTFKDKFAVGARENGMNEKQIDEMWDAICTFGSWAFNKSHSISYTMISYWTMWLKVYYPLEFYSSILSLTHDEGKQKKIMKEFKREGYKVLPVDINASKEHFTIEKGGLRIGFADIKGFGLKSAEKIVKKQPFVSYDEFVKNMKKNFKLQDLDTITVGNQNLINLGAFDSVPQSNMQTLFGDTPNWYEKKEMSFGERWSLCPWDVDFRIEHKWMPVLKKYPKTFKEMPMNIEDLEESEGGDVLVWGIVYDKNLKNEIEEALSRGKKPPEKEPGKNYDFCNFTLEDDTDFVTVRVSKYHFPSFKKLIFEELREDDVLIIRGKMGSGIRMLFANKILCLRKFDEEQS